MLRAFLAMTASSPRALMIKPTPTSGRNVTSDRSGQWLIGRLPKSIRLGGHHPHPALPHHGGGFSVGRRSKALPLDGGGLGGGDRGAWPPSPRQQVPGDQRDDAGQQCEGVVID